MKVSLFRAAIQIAILLVCFPMGMAMAAPGEDLRLQVARQLAEKGDYEKAIQELRLFLNEHPDAAEVYARIGTLRMRQGKLKQAADNFKVALKKNPNLAEAKDGLAKVKEMESKTPALLPEIPKESPPKAPEKAPAKTPAKPVVPKPAADAGYDPALDSAGSAQGIYAMKEFQEALKLYRDKQSDQALLRLKTVLGKQPGHPGAYYLGGVIRYEKGDMAKAAYNFKRSFAYPERGFNAHFYLGRINHRQNKAPEAIDHYEKYIKSTKSEAGRKQAEAYLAQLRRKKAEPPKPDSVKPELPAAAKKDSAKDDKHGHHHAADSSHGHGPHDKAAHTPPAPADTVPVPLVLNKGAFLPFVVADSNGASGRKLREAFEAFKKEKYEKSADLLKETIRQFGGSPNAEAANLDLAAVYIRLGLWDSARDRILDYLSGAKQPQRYRDLAFYLEGLMHIGMKDGEKAERALLKVKPDTYGGPSGDEVDYRLALAGEVMKDMKKWSAYLEKAQASAKDPARKAGLWHRSGLLHGRHGRPDRAIEFHRKVLAACGAGAVGDAEALCPDSRLRIADLEFKRKRWKEALAEYRAFDGAYPDHKEGAWVHYQIANIHQANRNLEQALNQYKKVIDNYPDSYWASQAQWKREDAIWRKEYEEVLD